MTLRTAWERIKGWWKKLKPPVKGAIIGFIVGYFFLGLAFSLIFLIFGEVEQLSDVLWKMYINPQGVDFYIIHSLLAILGAIVGGIALVLNSWKRTLFIVTIVIVILVVLGSIFGIFEPNIPLRENCNLLTYLPTCG